MSPVGAPGQPAAQTLATSTGFHGSGDGPRVGNSSTMGRPGGEGDVVPRGWPEAHVAADVGGHDD
eukprot:15451942-Alexandrium_andersonii.AAC.1